jgi:hypothetical protein
VGSRCRARRVWRYPIDARHMINSCLMLIRRLARRSHRHFQRVLRRVVWRTPRRTHPRSLRRPLRQRPMTVSTRACVATGIVGLGAAGLVAGALAFAAAGPWAPPLAPRPANWSGSNLAGGWSDPAFSGDPAAAIAAADPPVSLDPASTVDPADTLASADPDPAGPLDPHGLGDPSDPHDPIDPHDPPVRVPEPSSAAILAVALAGAALRRQGLSCSPAPNVGAVRRRGAGGR